MQGACGVDPGPFTWGEYQRLFLGWQRERMRALGEVYAALANNNPFRSKKKPARAWEFSALIPRPKRYKVSGQSAHDRIAAMLGIGRPKRKRRRTEGGA